MPSLDSVRGVAVDVYYLLRGVAVWAAWTVLKGTPFHDGTYGDLRRLTPRSFAAHVLPMAFAIGTVAFVFTQMPPQLHWVFGVSLGWGVVTGGSLVASTVVISRFVDWRLTRM